MIKNLTRGRLKIGLVLICLEINYKAQEEFIKEELERRVFGKIKMASATGEE